MPRIFISYSHADTLITERLSSLLRTMYGYDSVWYDERLHLGKQWWAEIVSQIDACDIFIFLLSNESLTSKFCIEEYNHAIGQRKHIIPIVIRQKTVITIEHLKDIQQMDMSGASGITPEHIAKLRR